MEPLAKLELIDEVQRLGLKYQFELEIKDALNAVYSNTNNGWPYDDDLYATALRFRLFRQHGYHAPEDVFERFKDEKGEFKASLCEDVKGMLSMYEASFFGFEGESNIDEAKIFSTKSLMALKTSTSGSFGRKIEHALDMPIHWRLNRLEARWFIDAYEQEQHMNPTLLQLAKLDFNMLQSIYQKEVRKLARWDITGIDKLPDMIKTILLAMYNTTNEIGYWTMKEKGFNIIPYLRKEWAKLCKVYLTEAKWYHKGYKPRFEEYLDNAKITMEALDYIDKLPTIMHCCSLIVRLTNDLGTSLYELARGDNLKAVQCYMNERGVSEEVGRQHINDIVHKTWKTMNEAMVGDYPFSEPFLSASPNLARASQFFYHHGDGHGAPGSETKGHLMPLLLQPITVIS
ncbi:hypothetical protein JCGZ_14941 [Jatropha curcas]|uniref:Terpene synthase N-terminal domain-containing protein n=1 Tax=Jatropha curcas TaxID=180498 RepID=A0A067KB09_JATCU|nr:hypothetical protein JCGZ_14941 [Jatropha curcas]